MSSVGFSPSHERSPPDEIIVPRAGFSTYVVALQELEPTVIKNAEIEIVSPVLKRDTFKWKDMLEKQGISFDVIDENFLAKVNAKKVKFQSGTTLICDLEIHMRESASGTPEPYKWVVREVHRYFNQKGTIAPLASRQAVEMLAIDERQSLQIKFTEPSAQVPVQSFLGLEEK